ncbi:hypothetical protein [Ulvibacter litoralis]|uniref:Uncharacterized protein n=1 Tax=Ulvibacter litoralis TaxID=227084 RepID=A0A1G7DKR0_9FLAO|nr:hypothetical protein [Ulvibacter litoralis]GHC43298.1 hypothetical protein GCM10008083_02070 [Ulvibacter litoralis]SDE51345.1 hypothetical protein SAMN05421855_1011003 [Ulvibacter litoralis]
MAKKGKEKNTKNKAKHSKLMQRKTDKARKEKSTRSEKLKAIIQKSKEKEEGLE